MIPNSLAEEFAKKRNIMYFGESSAKSNKNLVKPLNEFVKVILDHQLKLVKEGKKNEDELKMTPTELQYKKMHRK